MKCRYLRSCTSASEFIVLIAGPQASPDKIELIRHAITQSSLAMIRGKWSALVTHTKKVIQDKMDNGEVTSEDFSIFVSSSYSCEGKMNGKQFVGKLLEPSAKVTELFQALIQEGALDFMRHSLLQSIIKEYGDDTTKKMLLQYKRDRCGYTLATTIKEHLDASKLEHPTSKTPDEKFTLFKQKFPQIRITDHSLKFVEEVWEDLQEEFALPGHVLVLHNIGVGCLEITWCIPSEITAYFIQRIKESEHYKEQQFLKLEVSADGVHRFTESEADVEVKVSL